MLAYRHRGLRPWFALAFLAFALQSVVAGALRCEAARLPAAAPSGDASHADHTGHHIPEAPHHGGTGDDTGHSAHHGPVCVCAEGCHLSFPLAPRSGQVMVQAHQPAEPRLPVMARRPVLAAVAIPYVLPPALAPPRLS